MKKTKTSIKRSHFEDDLCDFLDNQNVKYSYEKCKIKYVTKPKTYTPDFVLENGIIIEAKGRFIPSDRSKHLLIKEQNPSLDIRFVFYNSNQKLNKRSKTTYGDWATRHGYKWSNKVIPEEWLYETTELSERSLSLRAGPDYVVRLSGS